MKTNFFVSYNHKDSAWAEWIAWQLEAAGYTTTIQVWDFAAGQNFVLAMQKAAAESERTLAVLSPNYLASRFTAPEWAAAFARDPTGEASVLVPVRVDECDLEGLLPQIVYVDLVGIDEQTAAAKLIDAVTPGRKKPTVKPRFPGAATQPASSAPPFPGASAPAARRRRTALPRSESYLFVNVPPMPTHFLGRDELLAAMVERLMSGTDAALSASGQGGIGKTTMAVATAHDAEIHDYFSDGVLWAGLGLNPDVMGALAAWGEALGVDVARYAEPQQRAQAIRNRIGLRRFLLVIDDAWHEDAAMLLKSAGGANCRHLLTTRDDGIAEAFTQGLGKTKVPVLDEEPAFQLLQRIAPRACKANPEAARQLARTVDGLPLALELLGAYLAPPKRSQFPELTDAAFKELADPTRRLELATKRLGDLHGEAVTLRETILLSVETLPAEAATAFCALGAFAPKPETFDLEAAQAVTGSDAQTIAVLVEKNLVEHDGQHLELHQTIREVAFHDMPAEARHRHAEFYVNHVSAAGSDWRQITSAYGQIKWAFESSEDDATLFRFIRALARYQKLRGLWADSLRWKERGLKAAEKQQDRKKVAVHLNNIGLVYNRLGQREKALEYYQSALLTEQDVVDRRGEATTLNNIGTVYSNWGQWETAVRYFERVLPIRQEVGDRAGEAVTLNNLGLAYEGLGQLQKALEYLQRALLIRREVGDRAGEAVTLSNLGLVYGKLGQQKKALQYLESALPILQEVGDRTGEASTLNNIGMVYINVDQSEQALKYFECALNIVQEVGHSTSEAVARFNIARALRSQGNLELAAVELRRVIELDDELQNSDHKRGREVLAEVEEEWRGQ